MAKWKEVGEEGIPSLPTSTGTRDVPQSVRKLEAAWKEFSPVEAYTNFAKSPEMQEVTNFLGKKEQGIDYRTGAPGEFRASLSRAGDTRDERIAYLNKTVGPNGWKTDKYGALVITPAGGKQIGWDIDKDTAIEERGLTGRDIMDVVGDTGPMAGAMAGGTFGMAGGLPGAMVGAGAGAFLGTIDEEIVDRFRGNQRETLPQIADRAGGQGLAAMGGEFAGGVLNALGAKVLGPEAGQMTPRHERLLRSAQEQGFKPKFHQVVESPLIGRAARIAERVMGDPMLQQNQTIARQIMDRASDTYGTPMTMPAIGSRVTKSIGERASLFRSQARRRYAIVDDLFEGQPVVPTGRIKETAQAIRGNAIQAAPDPETGDAGRTLLQTREMQGWLKDIDELPDYLTTQQMQDLRQKFYDAGYDDQLLPGLPGRDARRLEKAAAGTYDDITAGGERARNQLKRTQKWYASERKKFDDDLIHKLTLDVKKGGVEPEKVVDLVFRKKHGSRINRVKSAMKKKDWPDVQASAMDELIQSVRRRTDDPIFSEVLDGTQLHKALDGYGDDTLTAMFGKQKLREMRDFADALQLVGKQMKDQGGLVAAGIAARPWKNLGRIVGLGLANKYFTSPTGLKHLTTGFRAPQTRAGAAALTRANVQMEALMEDNNERIPEVQNLPIPPKP